MSLSCRRIVKQHKILIYTGIGLPIALVIGIGIGIGIGKRPEEPPAAQDAAPAAPTTWTCSMHPQIQTPEPGDCPICGMDLIPLEEDGSDDLGPRAMEMSASAMALAEIQTTPFIRDFPDAEVSLVGRLDYNETLMKSLAARFPLRIDRLFVNYTGATVQAGEHLAMVYSPELSSAQSELLMGVAHDPEGSLALAAREKLRLWDLLPEQIDAIIEGGEPTDNFELLAPIGGIVVNKHVNEGDYVQMGQPLFKIAVLDHLWLILDAYESDIQWLRFGQEVTFHVEAWPGEEFSGKIVFIEPELNRSTRTGRVRVDVPNPDGRLKPGMFARGTVRVKVAAGGEVFAPDLSGKWISPMHPEIVKDGPGQCDVCGMDLVPAESLGLVSNSPLEPPLLVPASAVLLTGKRAVAYVRLPDREQPAFEGREIALGPRAGDWYLVKEGLEEGERVVSRGAFKIDSALQIQARPSMMNPVEDPNAVAERSLHISTETAGNILLDYFALQSAMAGDDFPSAREALMSMMDKTGHHGPLPDLVHEMLAAPDMAALRRPLFRTLSEAMIAAVEANPDAFSGEIYRMSCPMVYDDREDNSADWLQNHSNLLNPYWGDVMLHCGLTKGRLR